MLKGAAPEIDKSLPRLLILVRTKERKFRKNLRNLRAATESLESLASLRRVENEAVESASTNHTLTEHCAEDTTPKYLMSLTTMQLRYQTDEQSRAKCRKARITSTTFCNFLFWNSNRVA
jgi:hypothetical protein